MWLGKVSIIMYAFSIAMLFGAYYMNQVFNDPVLASKDNITFDALDDLTRNRFALNQDINASLIFGDFISALKVIFGIITGSTLDDSLHLITGDLNILLLQGIVFDLASVLLWIYIVSGRSI